MVSYAGLLALTCADTALNHDGFRLFGREIAVPAALPVFPLRA